MGRDNYIDIYQILMVVTKERGEGETSSKMLRSTRGDNVKSKFKKHMDLFIIEGSMFSFENETGKEKKVPLSYKNYVKNCEPNLLPELVTDFCISGRTYRIAPSSLHGLELFSTDGVNVPYHSAVELMEYVGTTCTCKFWIC